jgi:hypothetical protein
METLSPPVAAHNLAAWFILAPLPTPDAPATPDHDYAVLEESIEAQTALVHETGQVRELLIENRGDVDLFIQAGDIVKGGRQDRSIGVDFIVPAKSGRIPLPAFCVEQARWHKRKAESAMLFATSKDFLASKKARLALRLAKDQHAVWDSVAEEQQSLESALGHGVHSYDSPSSLQLTYEHDGVRHAIEDYTTALEGAPATAGGRAVGVVWAINGVPSHADCYSSPQLFAKLWRKLLRAAATEAIGAKLGQRTPGDSAAAPAPDRPLPSVTEIATWLTGTAADQRHRAEEEHLPPRTRLRTRRGTEQHRFEAFDVAWSADEPVHVAVVAE